MENKLNLNIYRDPEIATIEMLRDAHNLPINKREGILKRIYDEELSLIAEGLKGHLNIPFDFRLISGKLVAADGEAFDKINLQGLNYYKQKAEEDERYNFLVKRAIYEYQESLVAEDLAKGKVLAKTIVTISPYPQEAEDLYGVEFVQSLGFHTDTKRAMLRAIERTDQGIIMHTRAIEYSDINTWNKLLPRYMQASDTNSLLSKTMYFEAGALDVLDDMQQTYEKISGKYNANSNVDIWKFIHTKQHLTDYYMLKLKELSRTGLTGDLLKGELNKLRREFWSAIKISHEEYLNGKTFMEDKLPSEVFSVSGAITESRRESFIACGMEISPTEKMSKAELLQEIFGQKDILRCVTCPYCGKVVDAKLTKDTIECLNTNCGAKLNTKTGKRIDKNQTKNQSFIDYIIDLLFNTKNN